MLKEWLGFQCIYTPKLTDGHLKEENNKFILSSSVRPQELCNLIFLKKAEVRVIVLLPPNIPLAGLSMVLSCEDCLKSRPKAI